MEDAVKKAKRKSSGTGAANQFIGQAIKKPKSRPFGLDNGLYFCGRCEKQVHHVVGRNCARAARAELILFANEDWN